MGRTDRGPGRAPKQTREKESGQGLVEYAFIIALVVIVLILIVTVIGYQTQNLYSNISGGLPH